MCASADSGISALGLACLALNQSDWRFEPSENVQVKPLGEYPEVSQLTVRLTRSWSWPPDRGGSHWSFGSNQPACRTGAV